MYEASVDEVTDRPALRPRRALFVATICVGSFLLFLVQPMIARMALPRLGGAPAVWNSAMLVYQALLLAGYAYAHLLGRFAGRVQAAVHLLVFLLAAITLPIGLSSAVQPEGLNAFLWAPLLFLMSIGLLFFVVASQAPLMQRWFTLTGAGDPYWLYAASNLGSFVGLLSYPLVVEPFLPVHEQRLLWSGGFVALFVLVGLCGSTLPKKSAAVAAVEISAPPPTRRQVIRWLVLSAVPSGLMLSTSLHLTTDIVAMPLIWVLPLGLYLLSFTFAFAANRRVANSLTPLAPLIVLLAARAVFLDASDHRVLFVCLSLTSFFVLATVVHSELFHERPVATYLTTYYLAMSAGGVIGGLFCALIAPLVFDWTYEHPLLIVATGLLVHRGPMFAWAAPLARADNRPKAMIAGLLVAAIALSLVGGGTLLSKEHTELVRPFTALAILGISIASIGNRALFAAGVASLMLCLSGWTRLSLSMQEGMMTRSYFGIYSILDDSPRSRSLVHGTTVHGIQNLGPGRDSIPTAYYAAGSGIGLTLKAAPELLGRQARIGVVGLGTGTLACYARPGQTWRFYEIDPAIAAIALNPKLFTFLPNHLPDAPIVIGDARLTLAAEPPQSMDLLAIDAFSSDSVPMHLLTTEAFAVYRARLPASGLLLVHISNRYLDLQPVVAAAARDGWHGVVRKYHPDAAAQADNCSESMWVALSPDKHTIERLKAACPSDSWSPLVDRPDFTPWTDDHASILSILHLSPTQ